MSFLTAVVYRRDLTRRLMSSEVDANFGALDEAIGKSSANFFGTTDPAADVTITTRPGMTWADLTAMLFKRRNQTNDAWVIEATLYRRSLPTYPDTEIPTSDLGPIYVTGTGLMEWDITTSAYVAKAGGATGGGPDQIFWQNGQHITENWTVKSGINAGSFSGVPITIDDGVTVTIEDNASWTLA